MLIGRALRDEFLVLGACVIVSLFGVFHFGGFDEFLFLRPALIHARQAPFRAATGGPDRFAIHENKNWVGMRRWQNAQSYPTALSHRHLERHVSQRAIGQQIGPSERIAVHDYFDRNLASDSHPRFLYVPI